jgi:hypothetical protein
MIALAWIAAGWVALYVPALFFLWLIKNPRKPKKPKVFRLHPHLDLEEERALLRGDTRAIGAARKAKAEATFRALGGVR